MDCLVQEDQAPREAAEALLAKLVELGAVNVRVGFFSSLVFAQAARAATRAPLVAVSLAACGFTSCARDRGVRRAAMRKWKNLTSFNARPPTHLPPPFTHSSLFS